MSARDPREVESRIVVESRRHVLFEDEDGYSIWVLDRLDDEPVAVFPLTEEGLDEAMGRWDELARRERRGRLLTSLAWVARVVGIFWIAFTGFVVVYGLALASLGGETRDDSLSWFLSFLSYPILSFLPTAFLASVAIYVVVWMELHRPER